jgi:hypothetical protein
MFALSIRFWRAKLLGFLIWAGSPARHALNADQNATTCLLPDDP